MNNQNQPPQKDELDELNNGCFGFIIATLNALVTGGGICVGGMLILGSYDWLVVWIISSFLVPIIVWFGVIIWFYSRKK